jgi:hypothetical protein
MVAAAIILPIASASCTPPPPLPLERTAVLDTLGVPDLALARRTVVFKTGFESAGDIGSSYVTPQSETTRHGLSSEKVHGGRLAHKGWLTGVAPTVPEVDGPNHRGYPTIQLNKLGGGCRDACLVELWVWADVTLAPGQWLSIGTFTSDSSSRWQPVVTVNVGSEGTLSTFHVPRQGMSQRAFQTSEPFPMRRWVRVTTYIDLRPNGVIATWQDGTLTSAARVEGGTGTLQQVHFGMYAPPSLLNGMVFNDDLTIWHLDP